MMKAGATVDLTDAPLSKWSHFEGFEEGLRILQERHAAQERAKSRARGS